MKLVKILYFWSDWCAPALRLQKLLSELKPINQQPLQINHIDAEKKILLRKKHKVKIIPTTIFMQGDREIERIVGAYHLNKYQDVLNRLKRP